MKDGGKFLMHIRVVVVVVVVDEDGIGDASVALGVVIVALLYGRGCMCAIQYYSIARVVVLLLGLLWFYRHQL